MLKKSNHKAPSKKKVDYAELELLLCGITFQMFLATLITFSKQATLALLVGLSQAPPSKIYTSYPRWPCIKPIFLLIFYYCIKLIFGFNFVSGFFLLHSEL